MSFVADYRDRVLNLTVRIAGCRLFHDHHGLDFPNLEARVSDDLCPENSPSHDSTPADQSKRQPSNLRYLPVKKSLDWPMKFASGLARFKLEGPMAVSATAFADFLRRCQSLEHLELVNVLIPFVISRTQPIVLNRLATFSTNNVESGHILSHMTLPKDPDHRVGTHSSLEGVVPTVQPGVQLPSDVDTVSLHCNHVIGVGSSMEISIIFIDKTRTQSLNLIERTAGAGSPHCLELLPRRHWARSPPCASIEIKHANPEHGRCPVQTVRYYKAFRA